VGVYAGFWHSLVEEAGANDDESPETEIQAAVRHAVDARSALVDVTELVWPAAAAAAAALHGRVEIAFVEDDVIAVDATTTGDAIQCTLLVRFTLCVCGDCCSQCESGEGRDDSVIDAVNALLHGLPPNAVRSNVGYACSFCVLASYHANFGGTG
jgi:hypothetical protein